VIGPTPVAPPTTQTSVVETAAILPKDVAAFRDLADSVTNASSNNLIDAVANQGVVPVYSILNVTTSLRKTQRGAARRQYRDTAA